MGKYIFKLSNYHAIKEAEIILEGITVLSGENGSGKSTVSRWLYYLVKAMTEYEAFVEKDSISEIRPLIRKIRRAYMIIGYDNEIPIRQAEKMIDDIRKIGIEAYQEQFYSFVDLLLSTLNNFFSEGSDYKRLKLKRLLTIFDFDISKKYSLTEVLEMINIDLHHDYEEILQNYIERKKKRDIFSLSSVIGNIALSGDSWPQSIALFENNMPLVSKREFQEPLFLDKAIYLGTYNFELDLLLRRPYREIPKQLQMLKMKIQRIIDGNILCKDEPSFLTNDFLFYKRKDGLHIPLEQAATGIESFAHLLQLLNNGYLQKDTLLIIDEPEVHLHPQWIVEYARLLVFLNKKIGMKILVSSHNPDMVSAIQSISRKEGILDNVHFYVAQIKDEEIAQYIYKDLGTEIGEVFESFNIALDRIQEYGE